jgi:hypothetical protein
MRVGSPVGLGGCVGAARGGAPIAVLSIVGALAAPAGATGVSCPRAPQAAVARAFHNSTWVVRARFTAADDQWSGARQSWTLIHIRILHAYKGRPPPRLEILTRGNDAGAWLSRGSLSGLGEEYLLFLRPAPPGAPIAGAAMVSDACGSSKPWSRVSYREAKFLEAPRSHVVLAERSPPPRPHHDWRWRWRERLRVLLGPPPASSS